MKNEALNNNVILKKAVAKLLEYGIDVQKNGFESVSPTAQNLLIFQAVNLAAKRLDKSFYDIKADVFAAAAELGKADGVVVHRGTDKNRRVVWSIYHPEIGTIGCHDKYGEIDALLHNNANVRHKMMRHFTKVGRESYAFLQLEVREVLEHMAERTRPDFNPDADAARDRVNTDWVSFIRRHPDKNWGKNNIAPPDFDPEAEAKAALNRFNNDWVSFIREYSDKDWGKNNIEP